MNSGWITDKDDPAVIKERREHYETLIIDAIAIASTRLKRASREVKTIVLGAKLEGQVPGRKSMTVAFPKLKCDHRWYVIYPWSVLDEFDADQFADWILFTVKHHVRTSKKDKK
jgi:hypothetical protein